MSENQNKMLLNSINYIKEINVPSKILQDNRAYKEFESIENSVYDDDFDVNLFVSTGFVKTISNILSKKKFKMKILNVWVSWVNWCL